jgi:hypothetical protein
VEEFDRNHYIELLVMLTGWSRSVFDNYSDEKIYETYLKKLEEQSNV